MLHFINACILRLVNEKHENSYVFNMLDVRLTSGGCTIFRKKQQNTSRFSATDREGRSD